jgi:hypothetical protein
MGLFPHAAEGWAAVKAGMVIYSVADRWGHAMLIEPTGESLELAQTDGPLEPRVFHCVPPLKSQEIIKLQNGHYLGVYETPDGRQEDILKDVCAAIQELRSLATHRPDVGLSSRPGCYCVEPTGVLTSILPNSALKTTSCVGLVEECYRAAGVKLVDDSSWPTMSLEEFRAFIRAANPSLANSSDAVIFKLLGIPAGTTTLRPFMTAYQMLAFERNIYPYVVQPTDPKDVTSWQQIL